jgi:hypothetical protein
MKLLVEKIRSLPRLVARLILAVIAFIIFVYYPVGMVWVSKIDDSPELTITIPEGEKGSYAVAMAIALIDREVNQHRWTPSDPIIFPGALLVRMPAFQKGVMSSLARFAIELTDQIGRTRGSSKSDPDLQKAAGLLNYSPSVWLFDLQTSWLPTASSPTQYRAGMEALKRYNERLKSGDASFEPRADNLIDTLDRIASDIGSASAAISAHVEQGSSVSFIDSADIYYNTKGRMYANYMLLRELEKDFANVIREKQLADAWKQMLDTLHQGMGLRNFVVINASADNQILPSHLAAQGFYLMRARTQIREVSNILLK